MRDRTELALEEPQRGRSSAPRRPAAALVADREDVVQREEFLGVAERHRQTTHANPVMHRRRRDVAQRGGHWDADKPGF